MLCHFLNTKSEIVNYSVINFKNGDFKTKLIKTSKTKDKIKNSELIIENHILQKKVDSKDEFPEFIGESKDILKIKAKLKRIKSSEEVTLLIRGETGTGKDVVASWVMENHDKRKVEDSSEYTVNVSGYPSGIVYSLLFGHKKGSFTGAEQNKSGIFSKANQKILFIDEVGDLDIERVQPSLLRAIENGEIIPTGGEVEKVDNMIITATNKNLQDTKIMRRDLYARLSGGIEVELPPLRDRREDIPLLLKYFIKKENRKYSWTLSDSCMDQIAYSEHNFPINVRGLTKILNEIHYSDEFGNEELEWHTIAEAIESYFQKEISGDSLEDLSVSEREPINPIINKRKRTRRERDYMIKLYTEYITKNRKIYGIHQWVSKKLEIKPYDSKNFVAKHKLDLKTMLKLSKIE